MAKAITAIIDSSSVYTYVREEQVSITRSRARCAGPNGVQFYAPGWRPMVFRSMEAARAKMERHPGFIRWAA
jgi:hypothetical protein